MSATTPAEADGPATIPELDDDALLAIFMHLPAPSLMTAMACSRGWRNIVRHSDVLWRQKLSEDFPMYDRIPMSSPLPDVLASNRRTHPGWATASAMGYSSVYFTAYDCIVRGMCEATCELLNPNLCEGKFASAFLCKVKFDKEVGALRLHRLDDIVPVTLDDDEADDAGARARTFRRDEDEGLGRVERAFELDRSARIGRVLAGVRGYPSNVQ